MAPVHGASDTPAAFKHVHTIKGHKRAVASAKFSPGTGQLLVTGSADSTAMLWNVATGQELCTLTGHSRGISDVSWSPDGRYLCTASDDNTLKFWDVETGTCLRTLVGHSSYVFCCNFSPHSNLLASGSFDETLRVWDVRTSACLRETPAHSDPVTAVNFSWDGTLLVSSSLDGLCRVWDTATSHCLKTLFDKDSPQVSYVRFTPNGRYLLSASMDGRLRLWDYEKGKAIKVYHGHVNKKYCIPCVFSSESGAPAAQPHIKGAGRSAGPTPWVVVGSEDGSIHVYGLSSQKVLQVIGAPGSDPSHSEAGHTDAVLCVDAHPSQAMLASCGHEKDGTVKLWSHGHTDME